MNKQEFSTGEVKVKQASGNRIFAGSASAEKTSGGMAYGYQNAQFGVKK